MVSDIYNSKSINRGKNIVELEFFPYDEEYTCEILGVTLILEDGKIFWCDCDGISKEEFPDYRGISICASELRWRWVDGNNIETERE